MKANGEAAIDKRIVRNFIARELAAQEAIIDKVPVFSKSYQDAVDRIEDLEEVHAALTRRLH